MANRNKSGNKNLNGGLRQRAHRFLNHFSFSGIFALLLMIILVLTACPSPRPQLPHSATIATSGRGAGDILKLFYWQAPTILNPHLAQGLKDQEASRVVYEPLATYNKNGKLIPFLAAEIPTLENGGLAKDGKSVTWKLKQSVKWSDGQPFTAQDVVFTYKFLHNPNVGATTTAYYEAVKNVEAIDERTVKINFKNVNPAWSAPFVGNNGMILPKHIFERYNGSNAGESSANLIPIGTGSYRVAEFRPGDIIIYEPNPHFREADKPFFKRVELKGGGDTTTSARTVLQTGDADYAWNIQVEAPILKQLQTSDFGRVITYFGPFVESIYLNYTDPNKATKDGERSSRQFPHPFFSDLKVRQALNYAINRDTIAKQLYGATGKPTANLLVSPDIYNSPNVSYEFNLQKAAAMLDSAGWVDSNNNGTRDKNGIEMKVVFQTSVNPLRQKNQQIIKQALEPLGIGVEIKSVDGSIFFASDPANPETASHFYADMEMLANANFSPDPGAYMRGWTCDEIPQKFNNWSKLNVSRYCNSKYDLLWRQSTTEPNSERRRQLFIQMNDFLIKDVALIPLVNRAMTSAVSNRLAGVDLTPWDTDTWNIKDWKRK